MAFIISENNRDKSETTTGKLSGLMSKEISLPRSPFNNKKKESFYSELSVLLKAGINLKDALALLKNELKSSKDKKLLEQILNTIIHGSNFSDSIKNEPSFTEYEYYSLKIGEETGNLDKVTQELGSYFKRKNEQRRNLINALSYPIVVLATAILSVFFMLRFVVPMFADIFNQNGVELPFITKVVIGASSAIGSYSWMFMLAVLGIVIGIRFVRKYETFQKVTSNLILKIPYAGELVRKMNLAQFTQAMALLTSSNVPLLNSIQLTRKMIVFYPLSDALLHVEGSVFKGMALSESLRTHKVFDSKMISLIKVAEETNQSEFIFEKLSTQYDSEVQHKSKLMSTIIEPIIIIILGSVVALILVSMYLPMFKLSTILG
jgi:type IV pilus assembly protein PilC